MKNRETVCTGTIYGFDGLVQTCLDWGSCYVHSYKYTRVLLEQACWAKNMLAKSIAVSQINWVINDDLDSSKVLNRD